MIDELIEQVARALAQSHGLDFDEVCGVDADPDNGECDSGTCIAACYEDHDAAYARAMYRADARAILPLIAAQREDAARQALEAAAKDAETWFPLEARPKYPSSGVVASIRAIDPARFRGEG